MVINVHVQQISKECIAQKKLLPVIPLFVKMVAYVLKLQLGIIAPVKQDG